MYENQPEDEFNAADLIKSDDLGIRAHGLAQLGFKTLDNGDFAEAMDYLAAAKSLYEAHVNTFGQLQFFYNLGMRAHFAKEHEVAQENLIRARQLAFDEFEYEYVFLCSSLLGDSFSGVENIPSSLANYDLAEQYSGHCSTPQVEVQFRLNFGHFLCQLGEQTKGLRQLQKATAAAIKTADFKALFEIQLRQACTLIELGDLGAAEKQLRHLIRANRAQFENLQASAFPQFHLGYVLILRGKYSKAIEALRIAVLAFAESGNFHMLTKAKRHLADALLAVGSEHLCAEAELLFSEIESFYTLTRDYGQVAEVKLSLGLHRIEQGKKREGLAQIRAAVKLAKQHKHDVLLVAARARLAFALHEVGQDEKAREQLVEINDYFWGDNALELNYLNSVRALVA